jgi:hypothetical protein
VLKLEKMKWSVSILAVVLALVLAATNSMCAMSCSAQPCQDTSSLPPCHQQHGAKTCEHVLPVADMARAVAAAPDLVTAQLVSELPATPELIDSQLDFAQESSPPFRDIPAFHILRI